MQGDLLEILASPIWILTQRTFIQDCSPFFSTEGRRGTDKQIIMNKLTRDNANRVLDIMVTRNFYDDFGDISATSKVSEITRHSNGDITITYINGQKIKFSVELTN